MSLPLRALGAVCVSAVIGGLLLAAPSASAAGTTYNGLPSGTRTAKTLVVGIDGASFDQLDAADMPALDSLRAEGLTSSSNLYAAPMSGTVSGPGWSSIATGAWPDKHGVVDNAFTAPRFGQYPDYLSRIEAADPSRSSLVVATWSPVAETIFGSAVDVRRTGGGDAQTTATAVDYLANGNPDNTFVHLDEVDGAGHSVGTNGAAYATALARADAQLGEMIAAVRARPSYASEQWTILVTADHGHTPTGGHGGNSLAERKVFVIASGPGIAAGSTRNDVKIVDIAPTVLAVNGLANDPAWTLDGIALGTPSTDAFDTLRPALQPRLDETRPAAGLLGWTRTAPQGWRIDDSAMPAGGVREWSGWSFATDSFFTSVEPGQKRETNVRARDVFAVADSDEWDDRTHAAGQFDSTLISPAYPVNGSATATLSYATDYVIDGPQSAVVSVSFDGAAPVVVKNYTATTNANETLRIDVPAGARTAEFRFRYTGQNSAFWTLDQVALTQAAVPAVAVTATASTRCLAGRAVVTVQARNDDAVPVALTAASAFGTRTFAPLAPGRTTSHAFSTRAVSVPAGAVEVVATATVDGAPATTTVRAPYSATTCK
ncbi:type I phosphodiesterase/nucleotide pyrophosphatase [Rathayibacter sp. PhB127]|uniref:alkaline phosphatase family protein n=1 Tax=Rathayibacter sp. PhB127 TaxID=2485176 RepID=UPI000F4B3584|nr:alkaline phosphatase family protein [Rathayibacter sp. PhB127]ROS30088.1 type I phosphodiesterase/nucleotide pyrophosphatase [Rathayibacter sp. PhB127]